VSVPTILVVENEVLVRMPLAEYLRDCGYRAVEAANAAEAKVVLNAGMRVDLVFTSIRLGTGQNGFMLANWVRQHHPSTKVLLASSIANAAEKAADLCANGPMSAKPSPHDAVLRRIQALLHQARRTGSGRRKSQQGIAAAG
jgi:DNA-binding NtrC family response regulator